VGGCEAAVECGAAAACEVGGCEAAVECGAALQAELGRVVVPPVALPGREWPGSCRARDWLTWRARAALT